MRVHRAAYRAFREELQIDHTLGAVAGFLAGVRAFFAIGGAQPAHREADFSTYPWLTDPLDKQAYNRRRRYKGHAISYSSCKCLLEPVGASWSSSSQTKSLASMAHIRRHRVLR